MKKARKALLTLCAALLLVSMTVTATVAYLTSTTEVVSNTFTIGSVAITLDEAKVDLYGEPVEGAARVIANEYKLIPGHNYKKDPIVHVTAGSEECWLFVKIDNGIVGIEADTKIADQMAANGWANIEGAATNIYAYRTTVDARNANVDVPVFAEFTVAQNANVAGCDGAKVEVIAYAVQADGFATAAAAWAAAPAW